MKRLAVLLGTVALLLGAGVTTAHAAVASTTEVVTSALPTDYSWNDVARLPSVNLEAGKQYRVWGSYTGTATSGSLQETAIKCRYTQAPSSSTNNLVTKTTIATEWVFTSPVTGPVTCILRGKAGRCQYSAGIVKIEWSKLCTPLPQYRLNVASVSLSIDLAPKSGAYWRQTGDTRFGDPKTGRSRAVDVLWSTTTLPAGTEAVQVHTGPEVTVESTGAKTPLRVRLVHFVRQLRADGSYCKVTSVTDEMSVSGTLHHYKFNRVQNVPLDPACGTTNVNVKVYVYWVSGHGGVVHGPSYSSAYALAA